MGCWSESCAVSGIEIAYGKPCYQLYVVANRWNPEQWDICVPPIFGKYDDYGGIESPEDSKLWPYKDFEYRQESMKIGNKEFDRPFPMYIHAEVFDLLEGIPLEFSYKDEKTIKNIADKNEKAVRDHLKVREDAEGTNDVQLIFSLLSSNSPIIEDFSNANHLWEMMKGNPENVSEFIKYHRRSVVLKRAFMELRKPFAPGIRGPQHNGEVALRYFLDGFGKIFKKWEDEIKEYQDD